MLSSVVNMTVQFGETLHILWQCVPYALEAVALFNFMVARVLEH